MNQATVVFPLVPVIATTSSDRAGLPWNRWASRAPRVAGSGVWTTARRRSSSLKAAVACSVASTPGGTGFEGLVDEAGAVFEGAGASDEQRAPPHQSRVLHHVGGTPAAVAHETGHTGEAGAQRIDRGVGS